MNNLETALDHYRKYYDLNSFVNLPVSKEIHFRIFCIKKNYDASGYGDISSLVNKVKELIDNRKKIKDIIPLLLCQDLYTLEELEEELKVIQLISESFYILLKKATKNENY